MDKVHIVYAREYKEKQLLKVFDYTRANAPVYLPRVGEEVWISFDEVEEIGLEIYKVDAVSHEIEDDQLSIWIFVSG